MLPREASPKQKAMLRFIEVSFEEPLTMSKASSLIEHVFESDEYRERLEQWNWKKYKLHPDLYASEMAEHQAARIDSLYQQLNQEEMSEFIKRVKKAEAMQIFAYLDQHFPNWDDDNLSGVWDYGLAAVQQLFPGLVKKGYDFRFPSAKARPSILP